MGTGAGTGVCEIENINHDGELLAVGFSCGEEAFRVQLGTDATSGLELGDVMQISLSVDVPWWGNGYVKVLRDGELMLAAMSAQSLPGQAAELVAADFFAPLSVSGSSELCDAEPDPGTNFVGMLCTRDQRQGIDFALGDGEATLLDRTGGTLGPLEIYVGRTVRHVEVFRSDTPGTWAEFIAVQP